MEDPFFVVDLSRVIDMHSRWESSLPDVQPFYAVKCNNDVVLLKILAALGIGFDCASKVCNFSLSSSSTFLFFLSSSFPYPSPLSSYVCIYKTSLTTIDFMVYIIQVTIIISA